MPEDIHWQKYASRFKTFPAQLEPDSSVPGIIVCIPVYAEPDLASTLESLWACDLPDSFVEVILFYNKSNRMTPTEIVHHHQSWQDCLHWIILHQKPGIRFSPVYLEILPDPNGGVGWARKLALDEAARRLDQEGIMLCLDGDCVVENNYLTVVIGFFQQHPSCDAASVYFEHCLEKLGEVEKQAIAGYELHLRYLVHAMRWAGHPFAYQTVGSAMAVRRRAYLVHGGMNTRQAGEDFYFLQKFIEIDTLEEIKKTTVFPSARVSGRVPFGTGRAMKQLLQDPSEWKTTSFETFRQIKWLCNHLDQIRQACLQDDPIVAEHKFENEPGLSWSLRTYLHAIDFYTECCKIANQTASALTFRRRWFRYFNAFRMIRYMHYMRDQFYPDVPVSEAARELATQLNLIHSGQITSEDLLVVFRKLDRSE